MCVYVLFSFCRSGRVEVLFFLKRKYLTDFGHRRQSPNRQIAGKKGTKLYCILTQFSQLRDLQLPNQNGTHNDNEPPFLFTFTRNLRVICVNSASFGENFNGMKKKYVTIIAGDETCISPEMRDERDMTNISQSINRRTFGRLRTICHRPVLC